MKNLRQGFVTIIAIMPLLISDYAIANTEETRTENSRFRTLSFSGYEWTVKSSDSPVGPGPNYFSDSSRNVWVDKKGRLHLKITMRDGKWHCAEVVSQQNFGYGKYIFYLASRVDLLNENVVLGLFTWDDAPEYNHREIDIEFSRWSDPANDNSQFVVQPWDSPGNMYRFNTYLKRRYSTHSFEWRNGNILFQSFKGSSADPRKLIESWNYNGGDIPIPVNENPRINLWLYNGNSPSNNKAAEVVINKFEFVP